MSAPRRFDYDECRTLFATGEWTQAALARKYGVTKNAVHCVVNDRARRVQELQRAERQTARCSVCGERCSFNRSLQVAPRCRACAGVVSRTTVRDDALKCSTCKQWKWDTEFPHSRAEPQRRGRHVSCSSCQTILRTAYRERRKVPCRSCGAPCLPAGEKGERVNDSGLCRPCWIASRRRATTATPGLSRSEAISPTEGSEPSAC